MRERPFDASRAGELNARVVQCVECGCSSGLRWKGWGAYRCEDAGTRRSGSTARPAQRTSSATAAASSHREERRSTRRRAIITGWSSRTLLLETKRSSVRSTSGLTKGRRGTKSKDHCRFTVSAATPRASRSFRSRHGNTSESSSSDSGSLSSLDTRRSPSSASSSGTRNTSWSRRSARRVNSYNGITHSSAIGANRRSDLVTVRCGPRAEPLAAGESSFPARWRLTVFLFRY